MGSSEKLQNTGYLQGQLLVATPLITGSCFEKSVVYICNHDENGAMGILINHVLGNLTCTDIFGQLNIEGTESALASPIHFGGPVESSRGFILHTGDYENSDTRTLNDNICITSTVDVLRDIALGKGPDKSIIALGCAGWAPGQLENEIKLNSWINVPANENLIFGLDNKKKWSESAKMLGVDLMKYSVISGNA